MSKIIDLIAKVHATVHSLNNGMKRPYSEPKIYAGGADLSRWGKLTKEEKATALSKIWYIRYAYINNEGKLKRMPNIKAGANRFSTKEERLEVLEPLRKNLLKMLKDGFNPRDPEEYLKKFPNSPLLKDAGVEVPKPAGHIDEDTPIVQSLRTIFDKMDLAKSTTRDMNQIINNVDKSIRELSLENLTISKFTRSKIKTVLEHLNLPKGQYNKYLTYLSILLSEAVEMELLPNNPVTAIRKKKTVKKIRETLTIDEFQQIAVYLKQNYYSFYRYALIFFQSGARSSELFRLQATKVNLEKQEYKALILKGQEFHEEIKIILPGALPLWKELMAEASERDHYLFSKGLVPGVDQINEYQITKRWKRLVKDRVGFVSGKLRMLSDIGTDEKYVPVTADFYALKHLFLDELDKYSYGQHSGLSSKLASHTTDNVTNAVYLVSKKQRANEVLKNIDINIMGSGPGQEPE